MRMLGNTCWSGCFSFRLLVSVLIGFHLGTSVTQGEIFMRVDGVVGGSNDKNHEGWIVVEHVQQSHVATGMPEVPLSAIVAVRKQLDQSSPKLAEAATRGHVFAEVELEFIRTERETHRYFNLKLQNVSVLSHRVDVKSTNDSFEYVVFLFERIDWAYVERHDSGKPLANHKAYWDLVRNVGDSETERLAFVVRATQSPGAGLRMEWMAEEGRTYELRATSDLGGTFEPVQEIPPGDPGKRTLDLPTTKPFSFYYLTEKE